MNVIWSKYIQGLQTLYSSRKLRFDDRFSMQYKSFFHLDEEKPLKILEIGCGPGALASALRRWYPNAEITAIDRDSEFIRFAKERENEVSFLEGDALQLPFEDASFDVTISNTVSEHISPPAFYGEQLRVLKPNGVCLVLSSRKGINLSPSCYEQNAFEKSFWEKAGRFDRSMEAYEVCRYPMNESELPLAMEQYGFEAVSTGYAVIDLTPDDPKYSAQTALDMINSLRFCVLEALDSVWHTMPEHTSEEEIERMKTIVNQKYDSRIEDYTFGKKYWETNVSLIMMLRGIKPRNYIL